jgi:outer membrane biosynthesis protein TonB
MKILQTESEKKAFAITSTVFALLFLLFFFYKISQPEEEPYLMGGEIAISFGNSEYGKGEIQPKEIVQIQAQSQNVSVPETAEPIVTQNKIEIPVVAKTDDIPKTEIKPAPKPEPKSDPKPSKSTTDALESLLSGQNTSGARTGQGNSDIEGDQGKLTGDMYANTTYGTGRGTGAGSGSGLGWGLTNRSLATRGKVEPNCNETGTVVVEIRVDKSGRVISAQQTKGTTNSASCLVDAAIATAKTFRWNSDDKAPAVQIGFIVINFKVGT